MKFTETKLKGAFVIDFEKREDDRGFFARQYCQKEFADQGVTMSVVQANVSFSKYKGTLRGMHYQTAPYQEDKLVRCTRGSILDVIVDMRTDSPTYRQWVGVELTGENYRMLFVPKDFAHGFITLKDDTEVTYQVSQFYTPQAEKGLRYNDPAIGIEWPIDVAVITDKDANWPLLK